MTMTTDTPITEAVFRRLVDRLSAEQLRRFPADRLPATIPLDAVDPDVEPDKYQALESLMWSVASTQVKRGREASEHLEGPVFEALQAAESARHVGAAELDRLTAEITEDRRSANGGGGDDWLADPAERLEAARDLARRMCNEVAELARAVDALDRPFVGREDFQQRVSAARLRGKKVLKTLQSALGRFQLLEMDIAHGDMQVTHSRCEIQAARVRELDEQIQVVRTKLDEQNRLTRRILRPALARHQREVLTERLESLLRQRDGAETPVSEDDLLRWLDVLTDASLFVPQDRWRQKAQRTRLLLYRLMNVYCLQQETSAQQIASNPMSRVNAKEAIVYYLQSEQFILQYFARKRHEVTLWLSGAAQDKLDTLNRVRDAILADYRRSTRSQGRTTAPLAEAETARRARA